MRKVDRGWLRFVRWWGGIAEGGRVWFWKEAYFFFEIRGND